MVNDLCANPSPLAIPLITHLTDNVDVDLVLDWSALSANPSSEAVQLVKQHMDQIDWKALSSNPNPAALELLKQQMDNISWSSLATNVNPDALHLLKQHLSSSFSSFPLLSSTPLPGLCDRLCQNRSKLAIEWLTELNPRLETYTSNQWYALSSNPFAIDLLIQHPKYISWHALSQNPSDRAIQWLARHHFDRIHWNHLSANPCPAAIHLLTSHPDHIDWIEIIANPSPNAMQMIQQHVDQINTDYLNALFDNPAIFL